MHLNVAMDWVIENLWEKHKIMSASELNGKNYIMS